MSCAGVSTRFIYVAYCIFTIIYCCFGLNDIPTTTAEKLSWVLSAHRNWIDGQYPYQSAHVNASSLVAKITQILNSIQNNYPSLEYEQYGVYLSSVTNKIILDINFEFRYNNLNGTITSESEAFDSLNTEYDVVSIIPYRYSSYYLSFRSAWIDLHRLCQLYRDVDGIDDCALLAFSLQEINNPNDACGGGVISIAHMYNYENCGCWTVKYSIQNEDCQLENTTLCTVIGDSSNIVNISCTKEMTNTVPKSKLKYHWETADWWKNHWVIIILIVLFVWCIAVVRIAYVCVRNCTLQSTNLEQVNEESLPEHIEGLIQTQI